jgi:hypothetical protein
MASSLARILPPAVLGALLRALLFAALFSASWPSGTPHKPTLHAVDEAPADVLPAGETRSPLKGELRAVFTVRAITGTWSALPHQRQIEPTPPVARRCAHPPGSRIYLPRRGVPRMRDDLGDH